MPLPSPTKAIKTSLLEIGIEDVNQNDNFDYSDGNGDQSPPEDDYASHDELMTPNKKKERKSDRKFRSGNRSSLEK